MKFIARITPAFLVLLPALAFAQTGVGNFGGIKTFITNIINFTNSVLVPSIFALAFLVFLWGMFKTFILGGSDEEKQKEGKMLMMYSIAGFVLMVSLWGIVNLIASSFGFSTTQGSSINNMPVLPGPR